MKTKMTIAVASFLGLVVLFQNCQNRLSTNTGFEEALKKNQTGTSSNSAGSVSASSSSGVGSQTSTTYPTQASASDPILNYWTTSGAKLDCSRDDAYLGGDIRNVGSDILVCSEYVLDMPSGSSRYGESYYCDVNNKFVAPPSDWAYSVSERKWSLGSISLKNHTYLVPGNFKLVIKDNQGKIYRSQGAIIKKTGSANCLASSSVTSGCTIQTANGGIDFSPSSVGYACTGNSDSTVVNSKGWYICKCN